jgi:outer membrane protein OmpA-like peptidoglycan-associated protein
VESREIYQEILDRDFSEIVISGHTDTSASNAYNEALSLRRSQKVRQDLIDYGVPAENIRISAEGEYRLLVSTPDDTVEVRNRRVEINAR